MLTALYNIIFIQVQEVHSSSSVKGKF